MAGAIDRSWWIIGEHPPFDIGSTVEARKEGCLTYGRSWHPATVLNFEAPQTNLQSCRVNVQFDKLYKDDDNNQGLLEMSLHPMSVRPVPPPEPERLFHKLEELEAFYKGGWWPGYLSSKKLVNGNYRVKFRFKRTEPKRRTIRRANVRLCRTWSNGAWDPPFEIGAVPFPHIGARRETQSRFQPGDEVEILENDDVEAGRWSVGKVVRGEVDNKYLISFEKEYNSACLRPCPPQLDMGFPFRKGDEVDVFHDDRWWRGMVTRLHEGSKYNVSVQATGNTMENVSHGELRMHQDFDPDRGWTIPSRGSN